MTENPKNSGSIDLENLRHDLSSALGTLQTAIDELHPHHGEASDAFELFEIGMERLKRVLSTIDQACPKKADCDPD